MRKRGMMRVVHPEASRWLSGLEGWRLTGHPELSGWFAQSMMSGLSGVMPACQMTLQLQRWMLPFSWH